MTTLPQSVINGQRQSSNISPTSSLPTKSLNKDEFLMKYNPSEQNRYCVQFRDRCFVGNAPKLYEVSNTYGFNVTLSWLEAQLHDLNESVGAKVKLTLQQINDCACLIMERHSTLKTTELMFFFRGMKCGDFGEFYGVVDLQKIMSSLNKFYKLRADELARIYKAREDEEKRKKRERDAKHNLSAEAYLEWLSWYAIYGVRQAMDLLELAYKRMEQLSNVKA